MLRLFFFVSTLSGFWTVPAMAEQDSFAIMLGGRQLGTLTFDQNGNTSVLRSTMDNTPLGVANGTFDAVASIHGNELSYQGVSRGSRERDIAFQREASTVTNVTITPASELTDLSDAAKVPADVVSPTEFFADLVNGGSCPATKTVYDGRRVVKIGTNSAAQDGTSVICDLSYEVIKGPGHLSPFRFRSIDMQLRYAARELAAITVSAGGFRVSLIRR